MVSIYLCITVVFQNCFLLLIDVFSVNKGDEFQKLQCKLMDALDSENISTIDKILTEFTSQVPQEKWTTKDQELINKVKAHLDALKEKQSIFFLN